LAAAAWSFVLPSLSVSSSVDAEQSVWPALSCGVRAVRFFERNASAGVEGRPGLVFVESRARAVRAAAASTS